MMTLYQLRDKAKREALDYLTDCVFFALAMDEIVEAEASIAHLSKQQAELEGTASQLRQDIVSFQAEMEAPPSLDHPEALKDRWRQTQEMLTTIQMQINSLKGQSQDLQTQIGKLRTVTAPTPPRGLESLSMT